jgi:hypothetical protein
LKIDSENRWPFFERLPRKEDKDINMNQIHFSDITIKTSAVLKKNKRKISDLSCLASALI